MAPQPVMRSSSVRQNTFWERFQLLAEQHIEEGNMLAGERLWKIERRTDASEALVIRSTVDPCNHLECSLDLRSGTLTCVPGSLRFQVPGGAESVLRRDDAVYTLEQALCLILDELVRDWKEECGERPTRAARRAQRH